MRRQRHLDGRRQTIRLQTGSAECSIYFNYGRGMAVGDFSAPLRFARNDGEGGGLGGPLSAIGFRLLAAGYRLSASGFRLSVCLRQSPPSPLRGPLPPDKQWGAREYIGARHPPLDRGGQGRSADFRLPAGGCRLSTSGFRLLAPGFLLTAPDSRIPILHSRLLGNNHRRRVLLTFIHGQFKIAIISNKQGREEYPCRNGKESSQW